MGLKGGDIVRNYVKFPIRCRRWPLKTETLYVYYLRDADGWLPLPPNICDNGCGLPACNACVSEVWELSKSKHPLTDEDLLRIALGQADI